MRGSDLNQKEGGFTLDIRKKFCTVRLMGHLSRLPREVLDFPSVEVFKAR